MRAKSIIEDTKEITGGLYMLPIPRETFDKLNKYASNKGMTFPELLARATEAYMKQNPGVKNDA